VTKDSRDLPIVTKLTRRELIAALGGAAALVLMSACSTEDEQVPIDETGPCPLNPKQEEGPFYVDEGLLRSDVTEGLNGVPLDLWIKVLTGKTCEPVVNAAVDVWSANADGNYSDMKQAKTVGQKFLRGIQMTDASGFVKFKTIYPGWYSGRTCHIHLKVHTGGAVTETTYGGGSIVHTGQLFFPQDTNEALKSVYAGNKNEFVNNLADRVFKKQGGQRSMLNLEGTLQDGFAATITVDVAV
jgi:protocatechuate 3,4-dioxygenase beta subunit